MRKTAKIFGLAIVCMLLASAISVVSIGNVDKGIRSPEEVDVTGGTTPTVDGTVDVAVEWADAASVSLTYATAYLKHDGAKLYVGFQITDNTVSDTDDRAEVMVDVDDNGGTAALPDDIKLTVYRDNSVVESKGTTDGGWVSVTPPLTGWAWQATSTSTAWSVEFAIDYVKLGLTAGTAKTIGFALDIKDASISPYYFYWPATAEVGVPNTWEDASSTDNWFKAIVGWLEGYTIDEASAPVPNVGIWLYGGEGKYNMTASNETGYYNFNNSMLFSTGIPVGNYSLVALGENLTSETLFTTIVEDTTTPLNITVSPILPQEGGTVATFKDEFANLSFDCAFTRSTPLVSLEYSQPPIPGINADGYIDETEAGLAEEYWKGRMPSLPANAPIPDLWIDDTQYLCVADTWNVTVNVPAGNATAIVDMTFGIKANGTNPNVNTTKTEHTINTTVRFDTKAEISCDSWALPQGWRTDVYNASTPNVTITGWTTITVDPLMDSNITDNIGNETISIKVVKDVDPPADIVTNLATAVTENNITLTWTGVSLTLVPDFSHYKVYWDDAEIINLGTVPATQTATTENTTYVVLGLTHGLWYFAVTVVDVVGNENITLVTKGAVPNKAPVATFTVSAAPYYRNVDITFTSTSTDPDDDNLTYFWDFGDGTNSTEANPVKDYTTLGTYNVTLTVTDTFAATEFVALSDTTDPLPVEIENRAPTASFTVSAEEAVVGEEITFTSTSTDPDGAADIVTYLWDFGDGANSAEANPKHAYDKAGSYEVKLTVTDASGATHTSAITTITVKEKPIGWLYIAAIIIIIIIIIAIIAAVMKKKKKPEIPAEEK